MDLWDMMQELRTGRPGLRRAVTDLCIAAWVCLGGLAANAAITAALTSRGEPPPEAPHAGS